MPVITAADSPCNVLGQSPAIPANLGFNGDSCARQDPTGDVPTKIVPGGGQGPRIDVVVKNGTVAEE